MSLTHLEILAALKERTEGEALFRPSSSARLLACYGSIQLGARVPPGSRRSSSYAKEGTAAHYVASTALTGGPQPEEWVGRWVHTEGLDKEGWLVDAEMAEFVQFYVDEVRFRITPGATLLVEQKLSLASFDPTDLVLAENRGTGDAVILDHAAKRITVCDLKYGKGVVVAGESPQLRNYGTMALLNYPHPEGWQEVRVVVVQPRLPNEDDRIKEVVYSVHDLSLDFVGELYAAMRASLEPDPPLNPGPHCKWCPAAEGRICPALAEAQENLYRDAFAKVPMFTASDTRPPTDTRAVVIANPGQKAVSTKDAVILPSAADLTPDEIGVILNRRVLYDIWLGAVEQRAVKLEEMGVDVPGWKIVHRSGNRQWLDQAKVVAEMKKLGVEDIYTEPKLKSPAQMEKILPKTSRPVIEMLVTRPPGALTLVRDEDRRSKVTRSVDPIPLESR